MKSNFNYKEVPYDYLRCQNSDCEQAENCLRYQVGLLQDEETSIFRMLNPLYVKLQGECKYFAPDQMVRYAQGITHLFDKLPYDKYLKIKKMIINKLNHSEFYRIYRKEKMLTPDQQDFIKRIFEEEKIKEKPTFDEYIERYDWQ